MPGAVWYNKGMAELKQRVDRLGRVRPVKYESTRYFFWNDKPYKIVKESRRRNTVEAWDIIESKTIALPWTDWRRFRRKAFLTSAVAKIFGKNDVTVRLWVTYDKIPPPFKIADYDGIKREFGVTAVNYLWAEKDLYNIQDYLESYGLRPPSRSQIQAIINDDEVVQFIQDENGEFIPLWRAY